MALHADVRKYYVFRALIKRFTLPILVIFALDRGLSIEQVALIATASVIIQNVLEVPSGSIADVIGHRRALVLSMVGQAVSQAMYLGGTFEWIFAGSILYWAAGSLMTGTAEALFYERLQVLGMEKDHLKLYGQGKGFATAVSVISMLACGWTYTIAWYLPFFIGIVQFVVSAFIIGSFGPTKQRVSVSAREGFTSFFSHFGNAARQLTKHRQLFWLTITTGLVIGPLFTLGDFQQAILRDIGFSAMLIGVFYAVKRTLGVLVQAYTHLLTNFISPAIFVLVSAVLTVSHYMLGGMSNLWVMLSGLMLGTIAWTALDIASNHYLNRSISAGSRATTISMSNFVRGIVQVGSIVLFGFLAAHTQTTAQAYGAIGVVFAVLLVVPVVMTIRAFGTTRS